MKVGTLVKVNEQHASKGDTGVIVKKAGNYVHVYWDKSDLTYWIEVDLSLIHISEPTRPY